MNPPGVLVVTYSFDFSYPEFTFDDGRSVLKQTQSWNAAQTKSDQYIIFYRVSF